MLSVPSVVKSVSPPAPGSALRSAARAAFWTLTALALPAAILTTIAWFSSAHVVLSQLSPFRVQYAVLLSAHALFCLLLRRVRWAAFFAAFALFNVGVVLHATRTFPFTPSPRLSTASSAAAAVSGSR